MSTPLRHTRQLAAIGAYLDTIDEFRTAQQIHTGLRACGQSIGLTTVYRCLQQLSSAGALDWISTADGEIAYRKCSSAHHHHLVCRACGTTVEISGPMVERWAEAEGAAHGFRQIEHTLELSGVCLQCSEGLTAFTQ